MGLQRSKRRPRICTVLSCSTDNLSARARLLDALRSTGFGNTIVNDNQSLIKNINRAFDCYVMYKIWPVVRLFALKRAKRTPLIVDIDDFMHEMPNIHFPFTHMMWFTTPFKRAVLEFIVRRADTITTHSDFLFEFLKKYNKNVVQIPTGVDTKQFRPRKPKKEILDKYRINPERTLMFLTNNFSPDWSFDMVFKSFTELKAEYQELRLLVIGKNVHWEKCVENVRREGTDGVIFAGDVPHRDVPYILDASTVCLLPMNDSNVNRARFPIKLMEYFASGVPTVASDVGMCSKLITHKKTGLLSKDQAEFTSNIRLLLADKKLRHRIGRNARDFVCKNFRMKDVSKQWKRTIENTVNAASS